MQHPRESPHDRLGANEDARRHSARDGLTGLFSPSAFERKVSEEFARALRYDHALSYLLVDLDLFGRVNEALGPEVGDEALKEGASILLKNCRASDRVGRLTGGKFSILLPHIDSQGAAEFAERIRLIFSEHTFLQGSHSLSLTVSIGIASFPEDAAQKDTDLLTFCEHALFRSKAAGRNRVSLYRDLLPVAKETFPRFMVSDDKIFEFQKRLVEIEDKTRRGYAESSKALLLVLEAKDRLTAEHAGNVGRLSVQLAEAMGLPVEEAEVIGHAGLLHDIGKICIADGILLKPGRFSLAEYEAMKQHPYLGYRIVRPIRFLQEEATLILHHHEWFNGEGYPCRLAGREIPLGSRIIAVIDSYDTMRQAGGRYQETMNVAEAVNELIRCAGTQFDPRVVKSFVEVLEMRNELKAAEYDKQALVRALEARFSR